MAESTKRAEIIAEIATLRHQQWESSTNATYVGWTPEGKTTHEIRADRIAVLLRQFVVGEHGPS
jgi:hypothetical protein